MKVTLNLAIPPSPRERYAFAWGIPAVFLALLVSAYLGLSTARSVRENREVQRERLKLQEREASLIKDEAEIRRDLDQPKSRKVLGTAQFFNALIDRKAFSLTEFAAKVTQLLPGSVRLTSLSLSQEGADRVARFVVAGSSEEAVENFLIHLEDSPDFKDVALLDQGVEQGSAAGEQVAITCTARYVRGEVR